MFAVLPPALIEASNGALLVIIACMISFDLGYLFSRWRKLRCARDVYVECRAAFSLLVLLTGFCMRTGIVWMTRHLANHNYPVAFLQNSAPALLVIGTVIAVVGGVCWIRVITPIRCASWTWAVLAIGAIAFGILMAI